VLDSGSWMTGLARRRPTAELREAVLTGTRGGGGSRLRFGKPGVGDPNRLIARDLGQLAGRVGRAQGRAGIAKHECHRNAPRLQ